jgi:hypothetical protein
MAFVLRRRIGLGRCANLEVSKCLNNCDVLERGIFTYCIDKDLLWGGEGYDAEGLVARTAGS